MQPSTRTLLEQKGYQAMPDGSFSRPDSPRVVPLAAPVSAAKAKRPKTPATPSELALKFEAIWAALKGPELTPEHRFHASRKWRLDYYHPSAMVAVELEGGIFSRGRHSRPKGMQGDCDKYNAAAAIGITVFRLTTGQVTRERVEAIINTILSRSIS